MNTLKALKKRVLEHESIKEADSAITLQALRTSTSGHTGEPLEVVLDEVLKESFEAGKKAKESEVRKKVMGLYENAEPTGNPEKIEIVNNKVDQFLMIIKQKQKKEGGE